MKSPSQNEVVVLLSGGIDSTACLKFFLDLGRFPYGMFIDYGQMASSEELRAARGVAQHYEVALQELTIANARPKTTGVIPGRNSFLLSTAVMERKDSVRVIALGIHGGTLYRDCSTEFYSYAQQLIGWSENGDVSLSAPFLEWSKADVVQFCLQRSVPLELTYSCENGGRVHCGSCNSCKDRELIHACQAYNA
jgi:7-cyano-7-deazaguanine synthase